MSKDSTRQAVLKYCQKGLKKRQTKNKKPELQVQNAIAAWAKSKGWYLLVTDATARYSQKSGTYQRHKIHKGTLDLTGSDNFGNAVFIEVKAPGRLNNLSQDQIDTLKMHVTQGRFAVVVDTVEKLASLHEAFLDCPSEDRRQWLISQLPECAKAQIL